ncbi:WhiB family transcriptional regulator [Streptomyces sp. NPDC057743]|uniref:WhiB family transcriptional regulator n=1 Tax=Streptomyces sp. NPDC057743 TaxID=3346236 RepID=UPI00367DA3E2
MDNLSLVSHRSLRGPVPWDRFWRQRAACRDGDLDHLFFAPNRSPGQQEALRWCRHCAVQTECLALALDERLLEGVFGGTTGAWRRALLARRPQVQCWRTLLSTARAQHLAKSHDSED